MRMQLVAIFACVSFALCCVCCVWPCIAFGSELTSEPLAEPATSGPAVSDAVSTADDAAGPVMLGAAPLAASAVTLDTVNNNVLNVPNTVWDRKINSTSTQYNSMAQWFTFPYYIEGGQQRRTLMGQIIDIKTVVDANKRTIEEVNWETSETMALLANDFPTVKSDVAQIKSAVTSGSGSGSVSIADEQWKVLSDTVQFQNFALLVLTLLSSASIGCSLWASFSKGWRR